MSNYGATQLEAANKLIKYDTMMEELSQWDGLTKRIVDTDGTTPINFTFDDDFNDDYDNKESTDVLGSVSIDGTDYSMTKSAFSRSLQMIGLRDTYGKKTPGRLMSDNLNYHFSHNGAKADMITLLHNDGVVLDMVPDNRTVFSTYAVADTIATAAAQHYNINPSELYFDYKAQNTLDRSALRLIVPDVVQTITSRRGGNQVEDLWSIGINIGNSMTGEVSTPLSVSGYLFAWWCTNGSTTTHARSEKYSKRQIGANWDDVREWLEDSTLGVLDTLPAEISRVAELTNIDLSGEIGASSRDIMQSFNVPASLMQPVTDYLVESDDLSAYGFMNAVTQAANAADLEDVQRTKLMDAGGSLTHALLDRCETCHRMSV